VVIVVTLLAHGCPLQAIVAAFGVDERTIAAWRARSGRQGQAVHESLVEQPRDLGQVQADELRVKKQGGIVWVAMAMRVKTRLWLGGDVSEQRDLPLIRRLIERVRRCAAHRPRLVCTDGLVPSIRALRETLRDPVRTGTGGRPRLRPWRNVLIAQVVKRDERRRVVDTERRIGDGTPARVETLRRRSQGDGVSNTADIERRSATFREHLAPLARRCRALARQPLTLHEGMFWVGTVSTLSSRPDHLPLRRARRSRPPRPNRPLQWCALRTSPRSSWAKKRLLHDLYTQIGLVLMIALAAKNAILIVEFAQELKEEGMPTVDAAVEATRRRFRPIVMTSIAFLVGVVPLLTATGAGAASQQSLGTVVFGGMLASTLLAIPFVSVFYVMMQPVKERLSKRTGLRNTR
jgi:hypothetical protein